MAAPAAPLPTADPALKVATVGAVAGKACAVGGTAICCDCGIAATPGVAAKGCDEGIAAAMLPEAAPADGAAGFVADVTAIAGGAGGNVVGARTGEALAAVDEDETAAGSDTL